MIQPEKRKYLSGDDLAFTSKGKSLCREAWYSHSMDLHAIKNRKLHYLWLANNQLTDIDPLLDTAKTFTIPDNNAINRAAKRETLIETYGRKKKDGFIRITDSFEFVISGGNFFDVINLDSCNHFDQETLNTIQELLDWQIDNHCYFFATFSNWSMRGIQWRRFPQYKRLASTREGINDIFMKNFKSYGFQTTELESFPLTYETGIKKTGHMFSFGWELTKK